MIERTRKTYVVVQYRCLLNTPGPGRRCEGGCIAQFLIRKFANNTAASLALCLLCNCNTNPDEFENNQT